MPHRCTDSFAWWRVVLSALGPASTTRFVLCAHFKFMKGDGTSCYPTVRRLAVDTDLNKDTIAAHRKHAIDEGWLIVSGSAKSAYREFYPALPDGIVAKYPELLTDQAGQLLSELARQSMHPTADQSSEEAGMRVRNALLTSPSNSDKSRLSLLTSGDLRADKFSQVKNIGERSHDEMCERLRNWLESSQGVQKYQHDPDALARLTPLSCRLPGYEKVIHQWCANRCSRR
jgi:hypothetical protein